MRAQLKDGDRDTLLISLEYQARVTNAWLEVLALVISNADRESSPEWAMNRVGLPFDPGDLYTEIDKRMQAYPRRDGT